MLQHEVALNDLREGSAGARLRLGQPILPNAENRLLFRIITLAPEHQLLASRLNLDHFAERVHVANDLLEIRRRHGDNTREFDRGDLDGPDIELNQIQRIVRHHLLLTIHDLNPELGRVRLAHEQNDALIVAHRLHELEEVDHVDAEHVLLRAVKLVEPVGLETEMHQNRVGSIHRHDLETCTIKFNVGIRQNVLDSFYQGSEGCGFDSADPEE